MMTHVLNKTVKHLSAGTMCDVVSEDRETGIMVVEIIGTKEMLEVSSQFVTKRRVRTR